MKFNLKKFAIVSLIGIAVSGCDVPEAEKKAARDTVIKKHLRETLDYYKSSLEQDKFIAMPELHQGIEMRECDKFIDLKEDKISYIPTFFSNVDHPYFYKGDIKPNQKYDKCVFGKLFNARVPEKYLDNFAFSLYRKNITSEDYQALFKKIHADGVITYGEAIELYNFIHQNEAAKRSKETLAESLVRWFDEK